MMNSIVSEVKKNMTTGLGTKLGLTTEQLDKGITLAGTVASKVLKESMVTQPTVVNNLFSKEPNTPEATKVVDQIGTTYVGSLTRELGLDALKASAMKDAVIPGLTEAITRHTEGNADAIKSLLSGPVM